MAEPPSREDRLRQELAKVRQHVAELERIFSDPQTSLPSPLDSDGRLGLLAQALVAFANPGDLAEIVLSFALEFTRSPLGFVGYLDQEGRLICPTLTQSAWDSCGVPNKSSVFGEFKGLWGWVLKERRALLSNSPSADARSGGTPSGHVAIRRFLGVPAELGGRLLGMVAVANGVGDYTQEDQANLERLAIFYALALERAGREKELQQLVDERTVEMASVNDDLLREIENGRRTRQELETFFLASPDLMCMAGEDGYFKRVNPAFTRTLGYSEEELLSRPWVEFVHPDDRAATQREGLNAFSARGMHGFEHRYLCRDGTVKWLSWSAMPGPEKGTTYAVARNISRRKRAEEQLRLEEARARALLKLGDMTENSVQEICDHALEEAVRLTGSRFGYLYFMRSDHKSFVMHSWSRGAREACKVAQAPSVFDLETSGLLGEAVRQRRPITTNDYAAANPRKVGLPSGHVPLTRHLNVPIMDGERVVAVAGVANKPEDYQESDVHHLQLLMMGMWRHLNRKQTREALAASEQRFRAMMETAEEGILVYDARMKVTFVNSKLSQLFGWTTDEILGHSVLDFMDDETAAMARARFSHRRQGMRGTEEISLNRKDGTRVWALVSASPLKDENGGFAGAFIMVTDVTRRREMEEELRKTQKLESLAVMAGGVAHDFNNLLQSIMGNTDLALMDTPPGSAAVPSLKEIQAASQRAAKLSHQMLAYSGHTPFLPQSLDLCQYLREILPELRRELPSTVIMEADLSVGLPLVEGDPGQLRQALVNLVTNAVEAMEGQPGHISISCRMQVCDKACLSATYVNDGLPAGRYLVVEVEDDGPGADSQTLSRAFDPFFSTKFPGRGLGLAVVLGIVRGHRGAVRLDSVPGFGTKASIYLPSQELTAGLNGLETSGAGPMVLVVDDDETVRLMARRMLERHGYRVLGAVDGWQGLKVLEENCHETRLALVDLTMPGPTGQDLVRRMHKLCPGLPVVLCSSYDQEEACAGLDRGELAGFLRKPFRMTGLLGLIARILHT